MRVRYTPAAQADIDDIYRKIARDNPIAAQQVEDKIRHDADWLGQFPGIGGPTDLEDVRRLPLVQYPYTIYYRVITAQNAVDILHVVHAATIKNLESLPQ